MRPMVAFMLNYFGPSRELIGAEIGSLGGGHATHLLDYLNTTKLYMVDPYLDYDNFDEVWSSIYKVNPNSLYNQTKEIMAKYGERAVMVRSFSLDAAPLIPDNTLDYVYIDANHDYEWVKSDIHAWWPKVKVGGVFGGHDWYCGVLKATCEFIAELQAREDGDQLIEFRAHTAQTYDWFMVKHVNTKVDPPQLITPQKVNE